MKQIARKITEHETCELSERDDEIFGRKKSFYKQHDIQNEMFEM